MMSHYEQMLSRLRSDAVRQYVATRYGKTHVITAGTFDGCLPLVLLHGINVHAGVWVEQVNTLADVMPVIAPDVPGYAGLGSWQRPPYAGASLADWLVDVLDELGVQQALVVGSSAGGFFALRFAQYAPERTVGVMLFNPTSIVPYRGVYQLTRFMPTVHMLRWLSGHVLARRWIAQRMVQSGMNRDMSPTQENVELAYLLLKYYRRRIPPPLLTDAELRAIVAPVWLAVGEKDPYSKPQDVMERVANLMPCVADITYLAGTGHDINKEQPSWFDAYVMQAWQTLNHERQHPQHEQAAQRPANRPNPVGEYHHAVDFGIKLI